MNKVDPDTLLDDLRAFADELGRTPTRTEMNDDDGPHSSTPYYTEWGSWNAALEAAGLSVNHRNEVPDDDLIEELQELAAELGRTPRFEDMDDHGSHAASTYVRRFGSWPDAKAAAGLDPETTTSRRTSREALLDALHSLGDELGRTPTQDDMNDLGEFSHRPYHREFGSWTAAVQAAGMDHDEWRRIPNQDLISALRVLANDLGHSPRFDEMNEHGVYSVFPYLRAFGSWNDALRAERLSVNKEHGVVEEPPSYADGWHQQRDRAIRRDKYECTDCGISYSEHANDRGFGLDVHHIEKARLFEEESEAHALSNLVTLCRDCHHKWEALDVDAQLVLFDR